MIDLPIELRIGVPSIDSEHFHLVMLLDCLILGPTETSQAERFSEVLHALGQQIAHHFNSEEMFFRSCGMPYHEVSAHIQAHDAILEQYAQLNMDMMANEAQALSGAARMIKQWILGHLLEHDVKIRQYVAA
jgi:hemerythrin-like metal-binding protein